MLSSIRKAGRLNGLGVNRHVVAATRQLATQPQPQQNERMSDSRPARHSPSFVQNMFLGRLETSQVFPYPMSIDDEKRETLRPLLEATEQFFVNVNDARKNDREGKVDPEVLDKLWDLGAFGVAAPEEYGGLGLNASQTGRLAEPSGMNDLSISTMFGAHQSIGYKGITLYGTEEQKRKYLPQVTSGKVMAAFALTEPSAGSDAANIKARAVKTSDGKHYILNGSKIWITNGGTADIMTVFARTEVIDARGIKKDKLTAFIVERGFGGVTSGPPEKKLGIHASNTTEVFFEDCKIPVENVLGKEGEGFKIAVNTLNNGRFGMGMNMGGTMRMCIQRATEHVTQRMTFGSKLETFGGIQEKIARFAMLQYVNQSIAYMLSGNMDLGSSDYQLEAAISKIFSSESAWYVCDETIQIYGGMGFMADAGLERFLRDLRIFRIFEGANDTLRLFIALTGMQYAGSHLRQVQKALQNPAMNLGIIFKEASKRAGSYVGLGGVDMTEYVDPSLKASAKQASECVDMFGRAISSLLMKYGKNVIHQQFHLNRIADAAIDIHAMTATLSRCTRSMKLKLPSTDHERLMTEAWCVDASNRVRNNLRQIHSSESNENFKRMIQISKNICDAKDVIQPHPIDV